MASSRARRAVVATANAAGYEAALDLADAGVEVVGDRRPDGGRRRRCGGRGGAARGIRLITGATLVDARARRGVEAVAVDRHHRQGIDRGPAGLDRLRPRRRSASASRPALNLASHAGARVVYDEAIAMHRAVDLPPGRRALRRRGAALARASSRRHTIPGRSSPARRPRTSSISTRTCRSRTSSTRSPTAMTTSSSSSATRPSASGPSQGRHANLNTIRLVAAATGKTPAQVGTTTFRPPLRAGEIRPSRRPRLRAGAPHRDA